MDSLSRELIHRRLLEVAILVSLPVPSMGDKLRQEVHFGATIQPTSDLGLLVSNLLISFNPHPTVK